MKKLLDIISFILILANVAVSLFFYFTTDMIAIPTHWTTLGQMNSYGQTWMILVLAGISVVVYLLMVWSERHHAVNLPFKVKNELAALPFIDKLLAWTNFLVMLLLLYTDLAVAQYIPMIIAVIYVLLFIMIVIGIYYTTKIYKCGR